ncbi:MAG: multicopper oxidase family protein [Acidobacteriota bacterium]
MRYFCRTQTFLSMLALVASGGWLAQPATASCAVGLSAPASFAGTIGPPRAIDINPDPRIVEIELTAAEVEWPIREGLTTSIYAYNGSLPGPTIEANLGDLLIVNFCNDLPVETTVHWHGLQTPATMDGSEIAQPAVPPGGAYRYEFRLLRAGTFWFHPGIRSYRQLERGLYGALRVRDRAVEQALGLPGEERDHVLFLDDIHLDDSNQIIEPFSGDRTAIALEQLNGREGETQLLNGAVRPTLSLERRVPHRLRLINASSSRFLRVSVNEHLMWRIGGDQGLLEKPVRVVPVVPTGLAQAGLHKHDPSVLPRSGLLLTPGERADVLIFLRDNADGSPLRFEWHDWQRGRHSVDFLPDGTVAVGHNIPDGTRPMKVFADLQLVGDSREDFYAPPADLVEIEALSAEGARTLPLTFGHTLPDWNTGHVIFFAQEPGKPFPALAPDDVHALGVGNTYLWEVRNLTGSHHNFHLHGFSFQHLETELVDLDNPENSRIIPEPFVENKDTILMVRRPGSAPGRSWSVTRLLMKVDDAGREGKVFAGGKSPTAATSGGWLAHCHILEHGGRGMTTFFQVDGRVFVDDFESGDARYWQRSSGSF